MRLLIQRWNSQNSWLFSLHKWLSAVTLAGAVASCAPALNRDTTTESAASGDGTPSVSANFSTATQSVGEYEGSVSIQINLDPTPNEEVVLSYEVSGSSSYPQDHDLSSGTVHVSSGVSSVTLSLSLVDDSEDESWETITVNILGTTTVAKGSTISTQTITIRDNDPLPDAIDGGHYYACALRGGKVFCWGEGRFKKQGQDNFQSHSSPAQATVAGSSVDALAVGQEHVCVLKSGAVSCWGRNEQYQMGNGTTSYQEGTVITPTGLTSDVDQITAGQGGNCARINGGLKCWGANSRGQGGNGTTTNISTPTDVTGLGASSGVTDVSMNMAQHTCAVVSGAVKCWGFNNLGQLGDGSTTTRTTPVDVTGLTSGATKVAVDGTGSSCAIVSDALKCWGSNSDGQLGNGTTTDSTSPVDVNNMSSGVTDMAMSNAAVCAIKSGALFCWGDNTEGLVGDGTTTDRTEPTAVPGLTSNVTGILVSREFACAIHYGEIKCWGLAAGGALGNGDSIVYRSPTRAYSSYSNFTSITSGYNKNCFVSGGSVYCQGIHHGSTLGDGASNWSSTPTLINNNLSDSVTSVGTNRINTCALDTNTVKCWGDNWARSVGSGNANSITTPEDVTNMQSNVEAITNGHNHQCSIQSGSAFCWGLNDSGQLGEGSTTNQITATQVTGLTSNVTQISGGFEMTCAVHSGAAKCWGLNDHGQLGDGTTTNSSTAVQVSGLTSGVDQVTAGRQHACARTNGEVWCWGDNQYGQLGNGSTTDSLTPVQVISSGASEVIAGSFSTCATVDSQVQCWGDNRNGEVGVGSTTSQFTSPQTLGTFDGNNLQVTKMGDTKRNQFCAIVNNGDRVYCWGLNDRMHIDTAAGDFPILTPTPSDEW